MLKLFISILLALTSTAVFAHGEAKPGPLPGGAPSLEDTGSVRVVAKYRTMPEATATYHLPLKFKGSAS